MKPPRRSFLENYGLHALILTVVIAFVVAGLLAHFCDKSNTLLANLAARGMGQDFEVLIFTDDALQPSSTHIIESEASTAAALWVFLESVEANPRNRVTTIAGEPFRTDIVFRDGSRLSIAYGGHVEWEAEGQHWIGLTPRHKRAEEQLHAIFQSD